MCWAKRCCSWQKRAEKRIPTCAPAAAEHNSTIPIQCEVKRWALKATALKTAEHPNPETPAECTSKHFDACDRNFIIFTQILNWWLSALMTLRHVMPVGNLLHCSYVFCNCQVRICDTLRLFCRTSTILFSLWCMIFITQCLWFQHMFLGTACYLLHSKQCLMLHITVTGN